MSGELYTSLFVGPKKHFTIYDLILIFVTTRENIIQRIKRTDDYKECNDYIENDSCIITDLYEDLFLYDDYLRLMNKLKELDIFLTVVNNCSTEVYNIGKQINSVHIDMDFYRDYWKQYTDENIDIFAGMYGEIEVDLRC